MKGGGQRPALPLRNWTLLRSSSSSQVHLPCFQIYCYGTGHALLVQQTRKAASEASRTHCRGRASLCPLPLFYSLSPHTHLSPTNFMRSYSIPSLHIHISPTNFMHSCTCY